MFAVAQAFGALSVHRCAQYPAISEYNESVKAVPRTMFLVSNFEHFGMESLVHVLTMECFLG